MRYVRFAILVLFIVVVLIPATLYGVAYFLVNSDVGRGQAATRVAALFPEANLAFEDVEVGAEPIDLHVHGLTLAPKQGEAIGTIEHLAVDVDPRSFFGGKTRVDQVRVDGFDLTLEFDADGRLLTTDILRRPGPPKPEEPERPARPAELRDLALSDGILKLRGPGWSLRLTGTTCAGRLASGGAAEMNLACSIAGGEARITRPDGEESFTLGESRVTNLLVQQGQPGGDRIVLEGLAVEVDGAKLEGSLTASRTVDSPLPTFSLTLVGSVPESAARLLSDRRLDGSVMVDLSARGDDESVAVTVDLLAVAGSLRLPTGAPAPDGGEPRERTVTGLKLTDVKLEAAGREVSVMGKMQVADYAGGAVEATKVDFRGAATALLPEGGLASLAQAAGSSGSVPLPAVSPESIRVFVDRLTAATATGPHFAAGDVAVHGVVAEYAGLNAGLRVEKAAAGRLAVDGERLRDVAVEGVVKLAWPSAKLEAAISFAGATGQQQATLDLRGDATMERDGLSLKIPFALDVALARVPGARLARLFPADTPGRDVLAGLLAGALGGVLRFEGDLRDPRGVRLTGAQLKVPREKDVVLFEPAAAALDGGGAPVAVDARGRRVRVGTATLAWRTERRKRR